jgi:selenocysteine lyase/cysteine desulfurase
VVDGAQALAHLPAGLPPCDIYLAGCHKWLGAGHPMGLAYQPRRGSQSFIENLAVAMMVAGDLDDPLLTFTSHLERESRDPFNETVDLAGLFSCGAAVTAELAWPGRTAARLEARLVNAEELAEVIRLCGWQPLLADSSLRSGIVLVQANATGTRAAPPEVIRSRFQQRGVAVTTYADGLARVSLQAQLWSGKDLDQLRAAFALCS